MKTHAIIPIFIPHLGCPNDCVFCNQKAITARMQPLGKDDVRDIIEKYLPTLSNRGIKTVEAAFYGGSFTGIPIRLQQEYLSVAKEYKDKGLIQKIHLSTRPDYIDSAILDNLKSCGADIIELGVQSFDEEVLRLSNRGHSRESVFRASEMVKDYGFELGLQLMIGLPGDTHEKSIRSAAEAVKIKPSIARIYPTIIIQNTELDHMYQRKEYIPLTLEDAVRTAKGMYLILKNSGINVIRIGLKSTDIINENGQIIGGTYHPAFRQLVEAEIARENLEKQLQEIIKSSHIPDKKSQKNFNEKTPPVIGFYSNGPSFSYMIGNRKSNKLYFEKKYPHVRFTFHVDPNLANQAYLAAPIAHYGSLFR
ncbi:MAG: radical SAM protein [Eubacteriales bacterium]|nr:radical SAM protein [Eubacteriales bacterium]